MGFSMYQSYVYLEIRVLLSAVPGVFIESMADEGRKDILSAKADFVKRTAGEDSFSTVRIQPAALHKVATFVHASGGTMCSQALLERLTGKIQEPPDDRTFTGFSVKVAEGGHLDIMFHQKEKSIYIEEIRIEEDRGRLTRAGGKKASMDWTYAGCPVMRIRTAASFELGEEAEIFLRELYTLLAYLKLVSTDIGESSVRCNAYAAIAEYPSRPAYYVKLRNLNSFNFVRKAVNSELSRQETILSSGGTVQSESRLWSEEHASTEPYHARNANLQRFEAVKPNFMVPVYGETSAVSALVELPSARRERIRKQYGLSRLRSLFICGEKDRADYFESAVAQNADPLLVSHWMAGELMRILNKADLSIKQCRITPQKFAEIMKLLASGRINSSIAKTLLAEVNESGADVSELIKQPGMTILSQKKEIEQFVRPVIEGNRKSVQELKRGEMAPLEYLTGCVMKETSNRADPLAVKSLIKEMLQISVVYVLTMGGAITARKLDDGTVVAGDEATAHALLDNIGEEMAVKVLPVRSMLSEETEPPDWAHLIAAIQEKIQSGTANGIVVTHGTDTLPYTAALLYWLFSSSPVPVVLAASSTIPSEGSEAGDTLRQAVQLAREKKNGVYVVYKGAVLSPLNLKYIGGEGNGFVNWNSNQKDVFFADSGLSSAFLSIPQVEGTVMARLLDEAATKLAVVRLYPGMLGYTLEKMLDEENGIETVILELYDRGTCNMRNSDYALKQFMAKGRKCSVRFYCTSQQECVVDFSEYATGANVWREGAVPMGGLTTESVIALYFAGYLVSDSRAELEELIETTAENCQAVKNI